LIEEPRNAVGCDNKDAESTGSGPARNLELEEVPEAARHISEFDFDEDSALCEIAK
jgi:hypothetical protein